MSEKTQEYKGGYSAGYTAGKKKGDIDSKANIDHLKREIKELEKKIKSRNERVYMQCLDMVLLRCNGWALGDEKIKDSKGYCTLAKVFADNSIKMLDS